MLVVMGVLRVLREKYSSPSKESSIYKGIPISVYTKANRKLIREMHGRVIFKFRGPRLGKGRSRQAMQATCLREQATSFAVYRLR